jgi:hypothetical protein
LVKAWRRVGGIAIGVLLIARVGLGAREHVAERFDVDAAVMSDGSLHVTERIRVRAVGGDITTFTRDIPARETDGIEDVDTRVIPTGDAPGQVEIETSRRRTRVTWHFQSRDAHTHLVELRYRVRGFVRQGEGEDWLRWQPFPARRGYEIEAGAARLTWPVAAQLRRPPDVEGRTAETSPIANGLTVAIAGYGAREAVVAVTMRFEPGAFAESEPHWQRDERRADRLAPAFLAAALMIGAAAVLALGLFALRYRRAPAEAPLPVGSVTEPPGDLPPALAGAIMRGRMKMGGHQLLAAVFDLARRGALAVEQRPSTFLENHAFVFKQGSAPPVRPHERLVLEALFHHQKADVPFTRALQRLLARWRKVRAATEAELLEARLIDPDRREGAHALLVSGLVVMGFAGILGLVSVLTSLRLGTMSMLVPAAFGTSGLAMVVIGATFSTLSPSGLGAARRWDAYRRYLRVQTAQGRVPADGAELGRILPYAAALGMLAPLGRALKRRQSGDAPPWLHPLERSGGAAATAALIDAVKKLVN